MSFIREIVLDTETTGLDPKDNHRIVEIGALEMVDKILTGRKFHYYVNPERDMPEAAYKVHGISGEFLKDKKKFHELVDEFLSFIGNSKLVIHNAPFDIKFLNHELSMVNLPSIDLGNTIDTLIIARKKFPGAKVNLDALCKRYGIDNSSRMFHGALKDAALLSEVYVQLSGGRQRTFVLKNQQKGYKQAAGSIAEDQKQKTVIVKPTKEELRSHMEFLKSFSM